MDIKIDLKEVERRANYAASQDGLLDIFLGVFLIFFGGAMASRVSLVPFAFLVVILANPLLKRIKSRYIYPRVGYVRLPQENESEAKGIVIAAVVFMLFLVASLAVISWWLGLSAGKDFWMTYILPPSTGFALAIGPFWLGQTYGLVRGYVYAVLLLLLGLAIPLSKTASGYEAVGLLCLIFGIIALAVGVFLFARFLKKYPAVDLEHLG
jgi:hypothetical protein